MTNVNMNQPVVGVFNCIIYSVILYLINQNLNSSGVYQKIFKTFGENVINKQKMRKGRKLFGEASILFKK